MPMPSLNPARPEMNPNFSEVCAAAATPPGQSGLAVIRISGAGSAAAAARIFRPASPRFVPVTQMAGYTCAFGRIIDPADGCVLDEAILTRFTAPHSYTGEDMVEISCHGGSAVKQAILDSLFQLGVLPAEPGEFTRRAFLNGKLDLAQAEAVMDLIQAEAKIASEAAAAQLQGELSRRIHVLAREAYALLARVELILEYPEHEENDAAAADLAAGFAMLRQRLEDLADSYRQGRLLREGLTVVIAGRPNSGKSSLLNSLAGFDRAIVTPIPGTTRDTVEQLVDIAGLPVRLVDTAGLHDTADEIERLGIDRTRVALRGADLVFWLIAPPIPEIAAGKAANGDAAGFAAMGAAALDDLLAAEGGEILDAADCPLIMIAGKDDLDESQVLRRRLSEQFSGRPLISFSAVTGEGLAELRQAIVDCYRQAGSRSSEGILITNSRHKACLERAAGYLGEASAVLAQGLPLDLTASLLRACIDQLAGITGDSVTDELINTIFSRFCVGK
jgi:tRNA modification GTPase